MNNVQSLNHSKRDCKYHIVRIPKCRRKALYGHPRQYLGEVFRDLARRKESRILEGHMQPDRIHMLMSIPPKHAVCQAAGCMKGESAIHTARTYLGRRRNCGGMSFRALGYFVSTVGADEDAVRTYIREQEKEDKHPDQLSLF